GHRGAGAGARAGHDADADRDAERRARVRVRARRDRAENARVSAGAIRPLREDEYDAWHAECRDRYAMDIEENGGVPHEEAQKKAVDDMRSTLPDGLATEGHGFFVVDVDG